MRGKFEGPCIPDPMVSRIMISEDWLNEVRTKLPEMPDSKINRFIKEYKITQDEAVLMSSELKLSEYFEDVVKKGALPRMAAHWLSSQMSGCLKERELSIGESPVSSKDFAQRSIVRFRGLQLLIRDVSILR